MFNGMIDCNVTFATKSILLSNVTHQKRSEYSDLQCFIIKYNF